MTAYNMPHFIAQSIVNKTKFSVDTFEPLGNWGADPAVLIVPKDSKFKNVADLVAFAKENPGKVTINGAGLYVGQMCIRDRVIGHEPGDLPARSGDDADDGADEAADAQRAQVAPMCLDHLPQHTLLWLEGQFFEEDMRIRHQIDDLGDGKQADERGHEGDAAVERFMDDETGFPGCLLYTSRCV